MYRKISLLVLFGLFSNLLFTQVLPPIEYYSPKQYGAENQNWAISQSSDNFIYVANNKGLLEFNGTKWQLYPSKNKTILRSVHVVNERIYTGCYMDFGYWLRNQYGQLDYISLSSNIPNLIEDEQFWNILNVDHWVLFQSFNRIYIYNTETDQIKIIDARSSITKMFKVNNEIYYQDINNGIYKILNGESVSINNDQKIIGTNIINIVNLNGYLLIITNNRGFFMLKDNKLEPWKQNINDLLSEATIYSSIQLKDQSFVLGTISKGMFHIDKEGRLLNHINQGMGLGNNTVLNVFQDKENNIWLALDNGINCINLDSPIKIYIDDKGQLGTVYASAIFKDDLYLGTNQGLFYKKLNSTNKFKFIEGTKGQVWCLEVRNDALFCGHNNGTFLIENGKANKISDVKGTWGIKNIEGEQNLLLQGNYNGLNVLEFKNGNWRHRNKISGFDNSSKYFDFLNKSQVFVNHEYKGVFKLSLDKEFREITKVVKDTNLKNQINSSLIKYNGKLLYAHKKGVKVYDDKLNTFKKDSLLSTVFKPEDYTTGKLIYDEKTNKLWSFSNKEIVYLTTGGLSNVPTFNKIPLPNSLRKNATGYENITPINNQQYLFGTTSGYIEIDLSKLKEQEYSISLDQITNNSLNEKSKLVNKTEKGDFKFKENNLEFSYSITEFDKFQEAEYQYKLEGLHDNWSEWTTNSSQLFKNLPYGSYTFMLKGRVGNNLIKDVVAYSFKIDRPWYLSNVMIAVYILLLVLFSLFMHTLYKNYYKKQREKLLQKAKQELERKKLENEQQLMSLENEKLQQDISNKNRELAISTMSLIKKNEFLNDIKKELLNVEGEANVKPVIKIIDKNLNNTDDWKFFQEAFNNADKDFLKKIKAKHPSLTPNDLRLCAYLRLNLSSKEIAPLLNISFRSVEVKRYRLRNKMGLPHKTNLTNYILEI